MKKYTLLCILILLSNAGVSQSMDLSAKAADSLFAIGFDLFKQRKFEQSITILTSAKSYAEEAPGRESALYASIVNYIGADYSGLTKNKDALPYLLEALDIRRRVLGPDHAECGRTLNNLAIVNGALGNHDEAAKYAVESLLLKEKDPGNETIEYTNSQTTLALIFEKMGAYKIADSVVTDLLERRKRILKGEINIPYANALNLKAGLHSLQYRFEEADTVYHRALEIMRQLKGESSHPYLSVFLNIGQNYAKMGRYEEAESTQRACVQLAIKVMGKNSVEYALALRNLGFVLQAQGRFREALPILEEALQVAVSIYGPESQQEGEILGNLAASYYSFGDLEKTAALLKSELDILEKSERRDVEYYLALNNYGTVQYNLGNHETSERYLHKAEETALNIGLPLEKLRDLHLNFGLLYLAWGRIDMAEKKLLESVKSVAAKSAPLSASNAAPFFELVRLSQRKDNYEEALQYAKQGHQQLEKGFSGSVNYLSEAELQEATSFFFSRSGSIFEAARHWNKPELNGICYDNLLFTKGFVLENAVKSRLAFEKSGERSPEWNEWKRLRRQIADKYSKPNPDAALIESLEKRANAIEKQMVKATRQDVKLEWPHWEQVRLALSENEAAIEFARHKSDDDQKVWYMAFILTKNTPAPQAVPLCEEQQLVELFRTGPDTLFPLVGFYGGTGSDALYNLVFKRIEPFIGNAKKVYFAPVGLFNRINFPAMAVSGGAILADRLELALLGSTRQIVEKKSVQYSPPSKALLLGGIDYGTHRAQTSDITKGSNCRWPIDSWKFLASSLDEVESAGRLLSAKNVRTEIISGAAASEQFLRKQCVEGNKLGVLHISSHANYLPGDDMLSQSGGFFLNIYGTIGTQNPLMRVGIAMSDATDACNPDRQVTDDGVLTAYEISLLNLRENLLAVVSACDSGLGDLDPTEGVWGLRRAFRMAGSKYVILSFWKIEETASTDFMKAFYNNWIAGKKSIPEAFSAAQHELRSYNPDPRYWAGFVLSE